MKTELRRVTQEELKEILEQHQLWRCSSPAGKLANFSFTDLRGLDLSGAELQCVCFRGADLSGANFEGASLRAADLSHAILEDTNLKGADLRMATMVLATLTAVNLEAARLQRATLISAKVFWSNLSRANLSRADLEAANLNDSILTGAALCHASLIIANLRMADLTGADIRNANLTGACLVGAKLDNVQANAATCNFHLACPEEGSFIAWTKGSNNTLIKLLIPEDAKRSSATTRRCRASKAQVLAIYTKRGRATETAQEVNYTGITRKVGEVIERETPFDDDRWEDNGGGIKFFLTRQEAADADRLEYC